jgi:hypothetical protein
VARVMASPHRQPRSQQSCLSSNNRPAARSRRSVPLWRDNVVRLTDHDGRGAHLSATKPRVRSPSVPASRVGWRGIRSGGAAPPDRMAATGAKGAAIGRKRDGSFRSCAQAGTDAGGRSAPDFFISQILDFAYLVRKSASNQRRAREWPRPLRVPRAAITG